MFDLFGGTCLVLVWYLFGTCLVLVWYYVCTMCVFFLQGQVAHTRFDLCAMAFGRPLYPQ